MRLILAALALTALALPAHAQRLDTRRVDIKTEGARTTCGFNSYPGLTLIENGTSKTATLGLPANEARLGTGPTMTVIIKQGEGDWRRPMVPGILLGGSGDATLSSMAIISGRLRVDGGTPITLFATNTDAPMFVLMSDMTAGPAVYAMIDNGKRVDIDLLDAKGAVLRGYSWDISRLPDAVETVSVVGWSCTSP